MVFLDQYQRCKSRCGTLHFDAYSLTHFANKPMEWALLAFKRAGSVGSLKLVLVVGALAKPIPQYPARVSGHLHPPIRFMDSPCLMGTTMPCSSIHAGQREELVSPSSWLHAIEYSQRMMWTNGVSDVVSIDVP